MESMDSMESMESMESMDSMESMESMDSMDTRTILGQIFHNISFTIRPSVKVLEALVVYSCIESQRASFWKGQGGGWNRPMATFSEYVRKNGSSRRDGAKSQKKTENESSQNEDPDTQK